MDGVLLDRFGGAAAFSFQFHNLLDGGAGGMLLTDDREAVLRRALWQSGCYDRNGRWHFLDPQDHSWLEETANTMPVYGLGMSNLTAAVPRPQSRSVPERPASPFRTEVTIRIGML